jgi:hypothetical protein
MAGIFLNGVWSMGFDGDPTNTSFLNISGATSGSGSTSQLPFGFGYSWATSGSSGINLGTNLTTLISGIRAYFNGTLASSEIIMEWYDATANAVQVSLRYFPDGHLQFYLGTGTGTPLGSASATGLLNGNTWTYIECKVTINGSTGSVECRINGNSTPVISQGSLNTQSTANTWVSGFIFISNFFGSTTSFWDDWYMLDTTGTSPLNTYLGNVQVKGQAPSANSAVGGRNAYTPTNPTNVNYTNVGNIPQNTSEYNADSTAGDYDMFRFPSISAATVLFLNEWVEVELDAAGARTVALDCYSASSTPTDSLGTAFTPPTGTYQLVNNTYVVDPSTGSAWTVTNAGNAELGVKTVS